MLKLGKKQKKASLGGQANAARLRAEAAAQGEEYSKSSNEYLSYGERACALTPLSGEELLDRLCGPEDEDLGEAAAAPLSERFKEAIARAGEAYARLVAPGGRP